MTVISLAACGGEPFPSATANDASPTSSVAPGVVDRVQPAQPVFAAPTTPGFAVDPDEAHDVATRLFGELVRARYLRDAVGLAKIETGPALAADIGYICLAGCRGTLRTADEVVVNVPRQQQWPVAFAANAFYTDGCRTAEPPCHDLFVVVQQSKGAVWKIAHYVTYSGTTFADRPTALADGTAEPPASSPSLIDAPAEYAAYLESLHRTGKPPAATHLAPDWFTLGSPDVARARNHLEGLGFGETLTYRADPNDPLWRFAASNAAQFACGTVHFTQSVTGTRDNRIIQPPDLSVLGDKVRPGLYTRVTIEGVNMACFEQHADSDTVLVLGEWGDTTSALAR